MEIKKIRNRNILFTYRQPAGWDLNVQLILGNRYNYIIDTGLGSVSMEPVKEYIKHDTKPIIVINTHYHWDHIWGNSSFRNCTILSHTSCRDMIDVHWEEMMQKYGHLVDGEAEKLLPDLTFEQEIYFPDDQIRIMYTPGHTADSISVMDEWEKVIHVGDNIGDSMEELVPSLYGEKDDYIKTLLKYKEMNMELCVSGHNTVAEKQVFDKILDLL
ncbi:MBL fold metallo-hydrolase [Paenibacillus lautus]|uniref:MBL fold metallo-hydrolase n=1 Tax=Paenibacillus lautus TaxID=1401 RepID=UPI003D2A41E0